MRYFYNKNHFWQLQNPHSGAQLLVSDWHDFWLGWGFVALLMKLILCQPINWTDKYLSRFMENYAAVILYSTVNFQQK